MTSLVVRFALTALVALAAPSLARGQLTLPGVQRFITEEEARSGSLLPFPAEGSLGRVTQTETGFEVSYDRLFASGFGGFGLFDLVFTLEETAPNLLTITLSHYDLGGGLARVWGSRGQLPSFTGQWSIEEESYLSYQINAPFNLVVGPSQSLRGTLEITAASGDGAAITFGLREVSARSGGATLAAVEALDLRITATDLDPYALTNRLFGLADQVSMNPAIALGLLPLYTNLLLGSEGKADFNLSGLSFNGSEMAGSLAALRLELGKSGRTLVGTQGLNLTLTASDGDFRQTFGYRDLTETYAFERFRFSQNVSMDNVMGSLIEGGRLFGLFSNSDALGEGADLALAVGDFLDRLAPRVASEFKLEGFHHSSDLSDTNTALQSVSAAFVFDLRDEIRFEGSVTGLDHTTQSGFSRSRVRADQARFVSGYSLWDDFVNDASSLISQSLALGEDLDTPLPFINLAVLSALGQGLNLVGYIEVNARHLYYGDRSDWDSSGFMLDALTYRQGAEQREGGTRWNLDASLDTLILAQDRGDDARFFTEADLQALADGRSDDRSDGGSDGLVFSLGSVRQNLDLDFRPWGPFFDKLYGLIAQVRQIEEPNFAAYRPLLREVALATLDQFDSLAQRLEVSDLNAPEFDGAYSWEDRPGVRFGTASMELVLNRNRLAYFLGLQDAALERRSFGSLPSAYLQSATLDSSGPALPDGFGTQLVDLYLDSLAPLLDSSPPGPLTWMDYLNMASYDLPRSETRGSVRGLHLDLIEDHLSVRLAALTLVSDSSAQADPPAYDLGYRLNWSGLESLASAPEAQNFLAALLPEQGVVDLSLGLGLAPEGQEVLTDLPPLDLGEDRLEAKRNQANQAHALATIDLDLRLQEIFAGSSAWQLKGQGAFLPEVTTNPTALVDGFCPLLIQPNLSGELRLSGLDKLEEARREVLSAGFLGPLEFLRERAHSLTPKTDALRSLGVQKGGSLTYELDMKTLGDFLVKGQLYGVQAFLAQFGGACLKSAGMPETLHQRS